MADILDSIDGAIHDWETSDDAMRWVPPDDRTPHLSPAGYPIYEGHNLRFTPLVAEPHEQGESLPIQQIVYRIGGARFENNEYRIRVEFQVDTRVMEQAMERVRMAMEQLTRQFAGLHYSIEPDPPSVETLRQRALLMQQSRGHGPDTPMMRRERIIP